MHKIIVAFMLIAATIFGACSGGSSSENQKDSAITSTSDTSRIMSVAKYTCTMHPEVISDTPDHCPKCGMKMVPTKDTTKK